MQTFIGLEIHIQLKTITKIFCSCRNGYGYEQNSNICPVCMGYPGSLPVLNERAVLLSYIVAQTLQCTLAKKISMERKNYFYPDLPKNYQISQLADPIGRDGHFSIADAGTAENPAENKRSIRIREVHLEEDAGKLIHTGDATLCDYNRAGTPLLEIVTEPDIRTGAEAEAILRQFQRLVRYLEVCDGDMEKGSMRCDANVSVSKDDDGKLPDYRVEIKNMNSPRFVHKALNYEIARQKDILVQHNEIQRQTRLWNENRDRTEELRQKETMQDYRYLREPDIPLFCPTDDFFIQVNQAMIEMPQVRKDRFISEWNITEDIADFLCSDKQLADFFERLVANGVDAKIASHWLAGDIQKQLRHHSCSLQESPLTFERALALLQMLRDETIHGKQAKNVLERVFIENKDPEQIVQEQGWEVVTDTEQILQIVKTVLDKHRESIADTDPRKQLSFFMGQIMKESRGSMNPRLVSDILREQLEIQSKNR